MELKAHMLEVWGALPCGFITFFVAQLKWGWTREALRQTFVLVSGLTVVFFAVACVDFALAHGESAPVARVLIFYLGYLAGHAVCVRYRGGAQAKPSFKPPVERHEALRAQVRPRARSFATTWLLIAGVFLVAACVAFLASAGALSPHFSRQGMLAGGLACLFGVIWASFNAYESLAFVRTLSWSEAEAATLKLRYLGYAIFLVAAIVVWAFYVERES